MMLEGNTFYFHWEVGLMEWLQAHLGAGVSVVSFFSVFGEELVLIMLMGFFYWSYDKELGKRLGLTVLMGLAWSSEIKNVVLRRRPYFDNEGIKVLRVVEKGADPYDIAAQGYSFPSIHSANAVGIYGSIALKIKKSWMTVLAVVLPILVGFSRVVTGVHYPTDVLAGWGLGLISLLLVSFIGSKVENKVMYYGILLVTALPGLFFCKSADYYTALGLLVGFMGGTLLEENKVRFENTRSPLWMILRVLGGVAIYFVLNTLLKLPFPKDFLDGGSHAALMVRMVRYAVIAFVDFGVYPMAFKIKKN